MKVNFIEACRMLEAGAVSSLPETKVLVMTGTRYVEVPRPKQKKVIAKDLSYLGLVTETKICARIPGLIPAGTPIKVTVEWEE